MQNFPNLQRDNLKKDFSFFSMYDFSDTKRKEVDL